MEKKRYQTPVTEVFNMSVYGDLLDWNGGGSIETGSGEVDAKQGLWEEEDFEDRINLWEE